jgi:transcriptional pleiotropic regulator of transition state genes
MKSTGIVRKLDRLGRIVLPCEMRRGMDIAVGDSLEFYTDGDTIVMKKYAPDCVFCGEIEDMVAFGGQYICLGCMRVIARGLVQEVLGERESVG